MGMRSATPWIAILFPQCHTPWIAILFPQCHTTVLRIVSTAVQVASLHQPAWHTYSENSKHILLNIVNLRPHF